MTSSIVGNCLLQIRQGSTVDPSSPPPPVLFKLLVAIGYINEVHIAG